uniref:Uncharacterized protein n=1 Tax=Panagrolaimus sp. PS1159 TaxID=55785 RepID=A0AC35GH84_9BILA
MKYVSIVFLFFTFFTLVNSVVITAAIVKSAYDFAKIAATLGKDVLKSKNKSTNFAEFIENLNSDGQYQKRIEGKLNEIQISLIDLQKTVDHLGFSYDLKHFNSHIKYPMKHLFHQFLKFAEYPSNSTIKSLTMQCHIHPPNSILETLNDMLRENWLIDQAKHYKYESPSVTEIIKKLDNIVEIISLCQAGCSGLEEIENARYDLKKLETIIKEILKQIQRSKDVIHGKTKEKMYAEIALDLHRHFEKKYNYGPLYTIWVGYRNITTYGNMPKDVAYSVSVNEFEITVFRAASFCNQTMYSETIQAIMKQLYRACTDNTPISYYNIENDSEITFAYTLEGCGFWTATEKLNDIFASNGGICTYVSNLRAVFAKKFPSNFKYKKLSPMILLLQSMRGHVIDKDLKKIESKDNTRIKYYSHIVYLDDEQLFVNQSFRDIDLTKTQLQMEV